MGTSHEFASRPPATLPATGRAPEAPSGAASGTGLATPGAIRAPRVPGRPQGASSVCASSARRRAISSSATAAMVVAGYNEHLHLPVLRPAWGLPLPSCRPLAEGLMISSARATPRFHAARARWIRRPRASAGETDPRSELPAGRRVAGREDGLQGNDRRVLGAGRHRRRNRVRCRPRGSAAASPVRLADARTSIISS
jgi:hypothetical protein